VLTALAAVRTDTLDRAELVEAFLAIAFAERDAVVND
jgi:hypothetical protein